MSRSHPPSWTVARLAGADAAGERVRRAEGEVAAGDRLARADDAYRIASVAKLFTATLALKLCGDGILELDRPLESLAGTDFSHASLRDCLAHRSGLPDYIADPEFEGKLIEGPNHRWSGRALLDWSLRRESCAAETDGFAYSDSGYVAVGLEIEDATGIPLHEVFETELFEPLGINSTWLEPHAAAKRAAVHHAMGDLDLTTIDPSFDWAGGGLVSTLDDQLRFLRQLLGGEIIEPALLAEMLDMRPVDTGSPNLRYDRYGLGVGARETEHGTLVGHTGAWGSFLFKLEGHELCLAGSVNRPDPAARDALIDNLLSEVLS